MQARARRTYVDALISTGVLLLVLGVLVSVDVRVREQASNLLGTLTSSSVGDLGKQVQNMADVVTDAARTQSVDHAPLLIFIVAATVLVLAMGRT